MNNNIYYIIAGGPSYLDVTEEEWKYLGDKHTLTFARIPYGSRKFEYYFSIERHHLDKAVLDYISKLGYLDTKLLLSIPESIEYAKQLGFKHITPVYKQNFYFLPSRKPWFVDEPEPPHPFRISRAKTFRQPIFRFRGQLIATINACIILGATEIRLIAVDLNDQYNWYDRDNHKYFKLLCKDEDTIKEYLEYQQSDYVKKRVGSKTNLNPDYNPNKMHTTEMPMYEDWKYGHRAIRGVSDVLQWMDSELREEGMGGIFITNKTSRLYKDNKLRYKDISDG